MISSVSVFVLFAVIQIISTQDDEENFKHPIIDPSIPQECYGPPDGVNLPLCCPLDPIYNEEELHKCGIVKPYPETQPEHIRRNDCAIKLCLMKNKGVLNDDDTVNFEKMKLFVDEWSKNQTHLKDSVEIAKTNCLGPNGPRELLRPFGPSAPYKCEADKIFSCLTTNFFWHCKVEETARCKPLKDNMDKCRQYVIKEYEK